MCTVLLPPGDNAIAINKYIISYQIRHRVTIFYVNHVGNLFFKFPLVFVYMSSGVVVSVVHYYSKDIS